MTKEPVRTTRHRARLTRQGQITVPKAIRDSLGAQPGDDLEFRARGSSILIELRPRQSVLDFAGLASEAVTKIPASAEDIDALVARGLARAAARRESGPRS
ncbi:MAG: AbrB/MazE/SpoVT family DNA-binding domain-containing protein [Chloroflexi bacterium]|nr:AbrB/MazE/SpoVT family DNA-binding domain-containing protein [Chloroflexota bacterium]